MKRELKRYEKIVKEWLESLTTTMSAYLSEILRTRQTLESALRLKSPSRNLRSDRGLRRKVETFP